MNTDKQLSKEHIDEIFTFVKSKSVKYIDLQYEIVDHMASAIEDEMVSDEMLDFSAALSKVYKAFCDIDFKQFVTNKQNTLISYWRRRWFQIFKSYFTMPKLILTILISFFCWISIDTFGYKAVLSLVVVTFIAKIITGIYFYTYIKKLKVKVGDYWFFAASLGFIYWLFLFDNIIAFWLKPDMPEIGQPVLENFRVIIFSFVFAFYLLFWHACVTIFPKMLTEEIQKKYAHLGLNFNG